MTQVFTIGHSNHDIAAFLGILKRQAIEALVDVRSDPYSRYAPQFNKADIERKLDEAGIEYRYSGAQLGGRPKDPSLQTRSGKPDYDKLATGAEFQSELKSVIDLAKSKRVVLMCSEADPSLCHRERIIAQVLRGWGVKVIHIMPDGATAELGQPGLF